MANMPTLLRSAGNNIQQTLNGAIANDTTTTMVLTDASTCSADGGLLEIDYDSPTLREVVYYNSKSTHTLTIADNGRGLYGTTAQSHLDGALVRGFFVDSHINNLVDAASTHTTASSTTTFTNKTIDANGTGNSISNLEVADFTAAAIVTEADTVSGSDNDTTLPTSAAVKDYVDNLIVNGWTSVADTWTYAGADDPSFTFTVAGDMTSVHSVGMKVKYTQTTVKYGIITKMVYSAPNTTYTIYGGTDYDLANAAITLPYISNARSPIGFPLSPYKWSVNFTDSTERSQTNPTGGTWYNLGTLSLSIPIGIWRVTMKGSADCGRDTSGGDRALFAALSTSNNSVSHNKLKAHSYKYIMEWNRMAYYFEDQAVDLSSKTTFYPIFMASGGSSTWYLRSNNDQSQLVIQAECVYI